MILPKEEHKLFDSELDTLFDARLVVCVVALGDHTHASRITFLIIQNINIIPNTNTSVV